MRPGAIPTIPGNDISGARLGVCKTHMITNLLISTVTRMIPTLTPCIHRCSFIITGSNSNRFFAMRRTVGTIPSFHGRNHAAVCVHGNICGRGLVVPTSGVGISLVNTRSTFVSNRSCTHGPGHFNRGVDASNSTSYCVCTPSLVYRGLAFRGATNEIKRTITYFITNSHIVFHGYHFLNGRSALCGFNGRYHRCFRSYCVRNAISFVFNSSATIFGHYAIRDLDGNCLATPSAPRSRTCKCIFVSYHLSTTSKMRGICLTHP